MSCILLPLVAALSLTGCSPQQPSDISSQFSRLGIPDPKALENVTDVTNAFTCALEFTLYQEKLINTPLSREFQFWARQRTVADIFARGVAPKGLSGHKVRADFRGMWFGFEKYGCVSQGDYQLGRDLERAPEPTDACLQKVKKYSDQVKWEWDYTNFHPLREDQKKFIFGKLDSGIPVIAGVRVLNPNEIQNGRSITVDQPVLRSRSCICWVLVGYEHDSQAPGGGWFLVRDTNYGLGTIRVSFDYVYLNTADFGSISPK